MLQDQIGMISKEVSTKTFEWNLKNKEIEKLKAKIKELEQTQVEYENAAMDMHNEHQVEIETLETEIARLKAGSSDELKKL